MSDKRQEAEHGIILQGRSKLNVSGVCDVKGFDDQTVVMETVMGILTVKGRELKVQSFAVETGSIIVEGYIAALVYTESRQKKSGIGRLFG